MRKPWHTKEWRKGRAELLKTRDKCEWCGAFENLVIHHPSYLRDDGAMMSNEELLDFKACDVMVLCRGCHLNYHKGYVPCKKCGKKWHSPRFETCWECFSKTDEGKEWIENRAISISEEEVPLVDVELPCQEKIQVYEDQLEYGGMLEVCNHQCPSNNEPNSCEIYKKYRMEEEKELMKLEAQINEEARNR